MKVLLETLPDSDGKTTMEYFTIIVLQHRIFVEEGTGNTKSIKYVSKDNRKRIIQALLGKQGIENLRMFMNDPINISNQ